MVLGEGDSLVLQPGLDDPVGTYDMLLCGKLEFYDRESCVQFRVKVVACMSTIVAPPNGIIPDQFNMWYSDPISYDISLAFPGYTQQPDCGYNFQFNVQYEKYPVQFPGSLYSLPAEAIYASSDATLYLQKCSQQGHPSLQDFECQGSPFEKTLSFRVVAWLENDPSSQRNIDLQFNFVIGNVCKLDEIFWTSTISDFEYIIYTPTQPVTKGPIYGSSYPLCEKECVLTTPDGAIANPSLYAMTFDPLDPSIRISTSSLSFNYLSVDLVISCASLGSEQGVNGGPSFVSNPFKVTYYSQCYYEDILPAFRQDYEINLYAEDLSNFSATCLRQPNLR